MMKYIDLNSKKRRIFLSFFRHIYFFLIIYNSLFFIALQRFRVSRLILSFVSYRKAYMRDITDIFKIAIRKLTRASHDRRIAGSAVTRGRINRISVSYQYSDDRALGRGKSAATPAESGHASVRFPARFPSRMKLGDTGRGQTVTTSSSGKFSVTAFTGCPLSTSFLSFRGWTSLNERTASIVESRETFRRQPDTSRAQSRRNRTRDEQG